jgi:outer membrane receptor protein involved in Fe transport
MSRYILTRHLPASVSLLAVSLVAMPGLAAAQTEEQQVQAASAENVESQLTAGAPTADEIIVTGSRIPRPNFDSAQPMVVLGGEQIEQRGYTNVADALEELPAFGVPGSNPVGAANQAGEFGSGQNFVNFFGLGDQRTLTVVNGRRFVSSNTASIFGPTGTNGSQVDFNILPTLLIDRIETIAVGGAPIYGSDAIAGTINVITKRNFQGIQLDAQNGITSRGDAREYRIRGAAGTNFADGRGNIVVSAEYNKQAGLTYADRRGHRLNSYFTTPADPTAPFANAYLEDRRLPSLAQYGIPAVSDFFFVTSPDRAAEFAPLFGTPFPFQVGVTDNPGDPLVGNPLVFNSEGNLVPIDFGEEMGDFLTSNGGNGFELPGSLLAPTRRYTAVALAQYQVNDNVRVFGEGWYANSKGTQFTGQPEYNSYHFGFAGEPGGSFIIDLDNPFLSPQARGIIAENLANNPLTDDPNSFLLGRANVDITSGVATSTVELYRFVGGLDGTFNAFGRELNFELVGNYGKSTTKGRGRAIVQQNLYNAINAVRDGSGNIVCAPGYQNAAIATISSTCAPLNPFGNSVSQAARDYITTITNPSADNEQWVGTASVSGSLFDLPGGDVRFALGYEHRREEASFDPGAFYTGAPDPDPTTDDNGDGIADNDRIPFGQSVAMDPVAGSFDTNEVFAELTVPLVNQDQGIPLVRSLELNGAFRYIDHSRAGGDPTYTLGATYQPVRDITFRGNYTRSVRSPAITEYFNPRSQIFTTADDPCDARFLGAGPDPATRQANCAAGGLPADFSSRIVDRTTAGTFSGNPNLTNEIADSWTVGVILRPSFVRNLTLAVDWVNIEVNNAVEPLEATNILNACYDSPDFPDSSTGGPNFCDLFVRDFGFDPTDPRYGQITSIDTGYQNAATRRFQGLVAELAWRLDTPFLGAESSLNLAVNYLYNHRLDLRVGVGDLTTLRRSIGYSKHQATTNLTYRNDGFAWQWQAQYIGKAYNDPDAPRSDYEYPVVDDVVFFNTSLSYNLNDRFRINFVVDNVFDTKQPFPAPAGGGTVTYFDGILGRNFKFGAGVKF